MSQERGRGSVKASELVEIYRRRRAGYEKGLLKSPPPLYEAVCILLTGLAGVPPDDEVLIDDDAGQTLFVVARTGFVLARFPRDAGSDPD